MMDKELFKKDYEHTIIWKNSSDSEFLSASAFGPVTFFSNNPNKKCFRLRSETQEKRKWKDTKRIFEEIVGEL